MLKQLGDDVAREILAHEERPPAGGFILVADAGRVNTLFEAGALLGVDAERVGDVRPRVDLVGRRVVRGARARHRASRDDVRVVRGAARSEDSPLRVADHPAGRGERDPPDDVLVRDRAVRSPVHDLELKEADRRRRRTRGTPRAPSICSACGTRRRRTAGRGDRSLGLPDAGREDRRDVESLREAEE